MLFYTWTCLWMSICFRCVFESYTSPWASKLCCSTGMQLKLSLKHLHVWICFTNSNPHLLSCKLKDLFKAPFSLFLLFHPILLIFLLMSWQLRDETAHLESYSKQILISKPLICPSCKIGQNWTKPLDKTRFPPWTVLFQIASFISC